MVVADRNPRESVLVPLATVDLLDSQLPSAGTTTARVEGLAQHSPFEAPWGVTCRGTIKFNYSCAWQQRQSEKHYVCEVSQLEVISPKYAADVRYFDDFDDAVACERKAGLFKSAPGTNCDDAVDLTLSANVSETVEAMKFSVEGERTGGPDLSNPH